MNRQCGMSSAPKALPNPSLKRSAIGRTAGPGQKCGAHYLRPGPAVLPLSSA